jgi:hypothetical protein
MPTKKTKRETAAPDIAKYEAVVRQGLSYAKERGWTIVKRGTFAKTSKQKVCLCPLMALVLSNQDERSQARTLRSFESGTFSLSMRASKILKVRPIVVDQFIGGFDNDGGYVEWGRGTPEEVIALGEAFDALGERLRKELKPRVMPEN